MDEKEWLILLGGAALGYLMSVAANFTTVPIGYAAGEFRSRLIERSKKRASAAYKEVRALHNGEWDKYVYAIHSWGFVICYLIMATGFGIIGFLTPDFYRAPFGFIGLVLFFLMSARRLWIVVLTLNRVQYFRDYEAQLKKRWPDLWARPQCIRASRARTDATGAAPIECWSWSRGMGEVGKIPRITIRRPEQAPASVPVGVRSMRIVRPCSGGGGASRPTSSHL
jgi:hypothetical protein